MGDIPGVTLQRKNGFGQKKSPMKLKQSIWSQVLLKLKKTVQNLTFPRWSENTISIFAQSRHEVFCSTLPGFIPKGSNFMPLKGYYVPSVYLLSQSPPSLGLATDTTPPPTYCDSHSPGPPLDNTGPKDSGGHWSLGGLVLPRG